MISASLHFGQYISQYDMRALASGNAAQSNPSSQLLAGVNDQTAAQQLHLKIVQWTNTATNPDQFLSWVKAQTLAGNLVTISVFTNEYLFYGNTQSNAGDSSYDHIVPVTGVTSSHPLSDTTYYSDDVVHFSDNGLWTGSGSNSSFAFNYAFGAFQGTRAQANAKTGAVYTLPSDGPNYGWAITGINDLNGDTVPVRVDTNLNYEHPAIVDGSNTRPASMPLTLTITVSNLQPNVPYKLYRYNSFTSVPDSNFNANAAKALQSWNIEISSGSQYSFTEQINSNEIAAYRAVRATAP